MQKMKMHPICKLLLGLCLMLLMCAPSSNLSISERDALVTKMMYRVDRMFGEILPCPPNVAEEVKKCIREDEDIEQNIETLHACGVIKTFGNCWKAGMLQCEDGEDFWRAIGSALNNYTKETQGCPQLFEVEDIEESFFDKNKIRMVAGGGLVCLIWVVTIMMKKRYDNKLRLLTRDPEGGEARASIQ